MRSKCSLRASGADLPVAPQQMLGMSTDRVTQIIGALSSSAPAGAPSGLRIPFSSSGKMRRRALAGARQYLAEQEGDGYWDMILIRAGLYMSITDATYRRPVHMHLPAEPIFKVRIVLSGGLFDAEGNPFASTGDVSVQTMSGRRTASYLIQPSTEPFRMLVLHGKARALAALGLETASLGPPFAMIQAERLWNDTVTPIPGGYNLMRLSQDIFASRDIFNSDLRAHYLAAKAEEILCHAVEATRPRPKLRTGANRILSRDILRLQEARSILTANLPSPPTIPELARMVGMNETKLKLGFRELFGETPQAYSTRTRLEEALSMIETTELPLSEISYRVGYRYPANFSQAFKRLFGATPRTMRAAAAKRPDHGAA